MLNLAIVSDIRLYREGLGKILGDIDIINIVDVTDNHEDILSLLEVGRLDIVLLDMRMVTSCTVLAAMAKYYDNTKIIAVAVPENDANYQLCVESGITGYLSKESTVEELVDAIKTVNNGSIYCPYKITQFILKTVKSKCNKNQVNEIKLTYSKLLNELTQREKQIAKLLAEGLSNKLIAKTLNIELSTVKSHVHNILGKMGVESRVQAAGMLQENNLSQRSQYLDLDPQLHLP